MSFTNPHPKKYRPEYASVIKQTSNQGERIQRKDRGGKQRRRQWAFQLQHSTVWLYWAWGWTYKILQFIRPFPRSFWLSPWASSKVLFQTSERFQAMVLMVVMQHMIMLVFIIVTQCLKEKGSWRNSFFGSQSDYSALCTWAAGACSRGVSLLHGARSSRKHDRKPWL